MLPPGAPEFSAWFNQFHRSCFRLETLQRYQGSGENDSIRAFLAGHNPPPHPGKREWMRLVSAAVRSGRTMQRVHVVTEPITDYMTFELTWSYAYNVAAGEDVRIVSLARNDQWPTQIPMDDFWLFDEQELFQLVYDTDDSWLGVEHITGHHAVARARAAQDAVMALAQPWSAYITKQPALASRIPHVQWPN